VRVAYCGDAAGGGMVGVATAGVGAGVGGVVGSRCLAADGS
jgi:hypothetical protein